MDLHYGNYFLKNSLVAGLLWYALDICNINYFQPLFNGATLHLFFGCFLQPPVILKPSEHQTEQEALEIAITKLLLKSYYDIVRKNVEDSVPKAIMHFLVLCLFLFVCLKEVYGEAGYVTGPV